MLVQPGKFDGLVEVRQLARYRFELLQPLTYHDPLLGPRTVPAGFVSDLASIRILREVCRWALVVALLAWLLGWGWVNTAALVLALVALVLYALTVGYGMRAAILHDFEYSTAQLPRAAADALYYRALHLGDGTAAWRSGLFWLGVRLGGSSHYARA